MSKQMQEANWVEVERIMRLCVSGRLRVPEKQDENILECARTQDRDRYTKLHSLVRDEAIADMNPFGKR